MGRSSRRDPGVMSRPGWRMVPPTNFAFVSIVGTDRGRRAITGATLPLASIKRTFLSSGVDCEALQRTQSVGASAIQDFTRFLPVFFPHPTPPRGTGTLESLDPAENSRRSPEGAPHATRTGVSRIPSRPASSRVKLILVWEGAPRCPGSELRECRSGARETRHDKMSAQKTSAKPRLSRHTSAYLGIPRTLPNSY